MKPLYFDSLSENYVVRKTSTTSKDLSITTRNQIPALSALGHHFLHETLFVSALMYGSEKKLWKEKERFRIRAMQMDNLRGLMGIRRMSMFPNARIRELCEVKKGLDERIHEGVLRWLAMWRGWRWNRSVGRSGKRWIDIVKECLKKRSLGVKQASRMV